MERWTFLILADEQGEAEQIRIFLRRGDDPAAWPCLQVALDGTEVPVDTVQKDYEAPEWKALELFTAGGGSPQRWEELKDKLRAQAG
ncbi:hypothetical protein [Rhabdothermincola sediminis]|uniref:hypothetical protein n=1 Tax=Rhabdothermincola sediminis TaxID=2751370 RepID=UPI001AA082D4|nr:hypothetical protein [Rhabdothermincola sediminis]